MTAEQKTQLAVFLDLADDTLRGGFARADRRYDFHDDSAEPANIAETKAPELGLAPQEESVSADTFDAVAKEILVCRRCQLHKTRIQAVVGEGVKRPLLVVIGEGPGADEDRTGRPFVGRAGQLLDKMLLSVNLSREKNCFIVNVVKCRPPNNRDPLPEETTPCSSFLLRQMKLLKPLAVLSLGRVATQTLLKTSEGIGKLRGNFTEYAGLPFLPTYHPSALLRDESLKRFAWEDLKKLRAKLVELDKHYALEIERGI